MNVIIKPIITEKMTALSEKLNRYAFKVARGANKIEIKKAVEELYKVSVVEVNTAVVIGKSKSRNTKAGMINGNTGTFKKAIVTLAQGDKIDFYSNI